MADTRTESRFTPPPWFNRFMAAMLRTPGLQKWVGRSTALLTFTGRKSGREYTTPVSYAWDGDTMVVTGHDSRTWWRNFAEVPEVTVRLAGQDRQGMAYVVANPVERLSLWTTYVEQQPMLARAQKIGRNPDGTYRTADLERVLSDTVVVAIHLD